MSMAFKCDRCGKCYDPEHFTGDIISFRNPVIRDKSSMAIGCFRAYLYNKKPDEMIDLCPECSMMFRVFMHRIAEVEEHDPA